MRLRTGFWLLLPATLVYAQVMNEAVSPLSSKEIVAYELARTPQQAASLLEQFSRENKLALLERSFYLDFCFLLLYGFALFTACRYAASLVEQSGASVAWGRLGNRLAWLGITALVADIVENIALLYQMPPAHTSIQAAGLAWLMATVKFGCISIALAGALVLFGIYSVRRITHHVNSQK